MKSLDTEWIDLDVGHHFPDVGSTFATYAIRRRTTLNHETRFRVNDSEFSLLLDQDLFYLPADLCESSLGVHKKVMFSGLKKLQVEHDYVTCHNILLRRGDSLSKEQTAQHVFPVFHTNKQIWWSSIRQSFAGKKKVMWTRSGYTKPFYDAGKLGGTDMAYYVLVDSASEGRCLVHNLNTSLFSYIFATAKWSGFGNERVFASLPDLPRDRELSDLEMFDLFGLSRPEKKYVQDSVG
jgi:hypothetical protein